MPFLLLIMRQLHCHDMYLLLLVGRMLFLLVQMDIFLLSIAENRHF